MVSALLGQSELRHLVRLALCSAAALAGVAPVARDVRCDVRPAWERVHGAHPLTIVVNGERVLVVTIADGGHEMDLWPMDSSGTAP